MRLNIFIFGLLLVLVAFKTQALKIDKKVLSNSITKYASKYQVEREILSCVLFVESSYRLNVVSETNDYGIAQINERTIKRYGLNKHLLLTNVEYSVKASAMLLAEYRRQFKPNEINQWIARYNIGYQRLTKPNIGAAYVHYNKKVWSCIHEGKYL